MTPADLDYLRSLLQERLLPSPLLELGAGIPEHSAQAIVRQHGIEYVSTDLNGQVDVRADFGDEAQVQEAFAGREPFGSLLIMNVLEHTFEPIRVLDNAMSLLRPGGMCVALAPTVWPIHSFPIDCWRILPDFYITYAERRGHSIEWKTFEYVGYGKVARGKSDVPHVQLPNPARSQSHQLYSRAVHKLFKTTGRSMFMPSHVATAVAIRKGG